MLGFRFMITKYSIHCFVRITLRGSSKATCVAVEVILPVKKTTKSLGCVWAMGRESQPSCLPAFVLGFTNCVLSSCISIVPATTYEL